MELTWHSVKQLPNKSYGWFVVATLPQNHTGSIQPPKTDDVTGDNSWRNQYGFEKAWFNYGEWYGKNHENRTINLTAYVTHWGEIPTLPELTEPFKYTGSRGLSLYDKASKESIRKMAEDAWEMWNEGRGTPCNPYAFAEGFIAAFKQLGFL